ncbi:hypothetical protein ACVWXN_007070 [Bradyrhizobium sp. i1.4.4]|uniref:hypothetical protein n=1 Tax=Bradyrhizobium sp. LA6.10 TaxID=3156318 RepID=UPI003392390E
MDIDEFAHALGVVFGRRRWVTLDLAPGPVHIEADEEIDGALAAGCGAAIRMEVLPVQIDGVCGAAYWGAAWQNIARLLRKSFTRPATTAPPMSSRQCQGLCGAPKGFARLEPPLPDDAYEAALLRPKGSKSNCDRRLLGLHLYRI